MSARVRWAGDRAFLVELDSLAEAMSFHRRVVGAALGHIDQVAAARTVLLTFGSSLAARRAAKRVSEVDLTPVPLTGRLTIDIDVMYNGEDLDEVAALVGLSPAAVVAAHVASEWTAAFGGFAPGFAYLVGGDPRLQVPRRVTPRTVVPAGSVAIAGEYSAVYPRQSPGGWRLLGRTSAPLWDMARPDPALIAPGDRVRFRAVREIVPARAAAPSHKMEAPGALTVVAPGLLTLIEDLGRPGFADLGVTASGAADSTSARAANRMLGNARQAAVIETLGGLTVRAETDLVVAITGATCPAWILQSEREPLAAPFHTPFLLRTGEELVVDYPHHGLRTYVGVRGGLAAPASLESRSRDTLGALGPDPLRAGDALGLAHDALGAVVAEAAPPADFADVARLRIRFGPRDDAFAPEELAHLTSTEWIVGGQTDRIGARLGPADGSRPLRPLPGELASEGVAIGSLQVPPSGEPVLFGADHPVTGGYPVIAVVIAADVPRAAQLRPGDRVRFLQIDSESLNSLTVI